MEELPENYLVCIDLVFGNLCEGQEETFKLLINFFWKERNSEKKESQSVDWSYRISQRIHQKYGDSLLISMRMPEANLQSS